MSTDGDQIQEKQMLHDFCRLIGGEDLRRLPDGRWTFVVRHTVTAEDIRKTGFTKPTPFIELFEDKP